MFRTDISTILGSPTGENGCFHWSCVEHSLALPWFYAAVVASKDQTTAMVQVMDPTILIELLEQNGETIQIKDVQLVTPPCMNGSESWKMEKLLEFSLCHNKYEGSFEVYEVENGCYTTLQLTQESTNNDVEKIVIYKRDALNL
jgi:hypothetical protein